jgi:hypothetical protein
MEQREAARFGGYTWPEYKQLPQAERVHTLAHYRLEQMMKRIADVDARLRARP